VLKIYIEKDKSISTIKMHYYNYSFESNAVALSGSGDVVASATIKTTDFLVKLAGSRNVNLDVEATDIDAQLSSGRLKIKERRLI
jgi:hypothetical protein